MITPLLLVVSTSVPSLQDTPDPTAEGHAQAGHAKGVDLSEDELPSIGYQGEERPPSGGLADHVLSRAWFENLGIWGFASLAYVDTGSTGSYPHGAFLVKESSLFLEAETWEDMSVFVELQLNRLGSDDHKVDGGDTLGIRTGEVHAHFRDVFDSGVGVKVGRVDLPFGEEYLWMDSPDNPLITASAPFVYGYDEGIVVYGDAGPVGWVASVTDGTYKRSSDDHPAKAVSGKLHGEPLDGLYLSGSVLLNGEAHKSAVQFGGQHIIPVGAYGTSTAGTSSSERVESTLWEVDAVYSPAEDVDVSLFYGMADIDDGDDAFSRQVDWYMVQPRWRVSEGVFLTARYSAIGTDDGDEGFHFDGKIIADGHNTFGFDATELRRLSAGVGWRPNPRTVMKAEIGKDWFELIDASPLQTNNSDRLFFGVELTLSF